MMKQDEIVIDESRVKSWLDIFGINAPLLNTVEFLHKDEYIKGERQIRIILVAETGHETVVFKLFHESGCSYEIIASQLAFARKVKAGGVLTPKQFLAAGGYINKQLTGGMECLLLCEEYIGEPPERLTEQLEYEIGKLTGRLHKISERENIRINNERLYKEVIRESGYAMIWSYEECPYKDLYIRISERHDKYIKVLAKIWPTLPKAAVQGDIFGLNNIIETDNGLAVIDYNLASDEVFVGDFILSWFRTVSDIDMEPFINDENEDMMWDSFLKGYEQARVFTPAEQGIFPMIYGVLGAVVLSKTAKELYAEGNMESAYKFIKKAEESLFFPRGI